MIIANHTRLPARALTLVSMGEVVGMTLATTEATLVQEFST